MENMFKHSFSVKSLPHTLQLATIIFIQKENKDPGEPASYRGISNQNLDSKFLVKPFARRLHSE